MTSKKVCVIIPTLNEEEYIGGLIDSIQKDPYENIEIVVVDDGSTDKTIEIANSKGVTILENSPGHCGPAHGWNRVARKTDADVLCILGADFLIEDTNYFEKCMNAFDDDTIALYTAYRTNQDTLIEKIVTKPEGISFDPRFIQKEAFLQIGGYPEIGVGEDVVFTKRLKEFTKKTGKKDKIVKDAYFSGHGVHSIKAMYKQAKWYGKTSPLFMRELKGKDRMLHGIKFYSRAIYFLSFCSIFLIPSSRFFLITGFPFLLILAYLLAGGIKNKYNIGKLVLFLIFGAGMIHGLLSYLFRLGKVGGGR
jgi:glycosyltransferase involved in cell wall biosynthesis